MVVTKKDEMEKGVVYIGGEPFLYPKCWTYSVLDENDDKVTLTVAHLQHNETGIYQIAEFLERKIEKVTHEIVISRNDVIEYEFVTIDDFIDFINKHLTDDNIQAVIFCWKFALVYSNIDRKKVKPKEFCFTIFKEVRAAIKDYGIDLNKTLMSVDYLHSPWNPPYPRS